jgi:predicted RNA-binding protein with PUA-like domain
LAKDDPVNVRHWLVKQEPADYPWSRFVQEKTVAWTGIRNYQARNHLRAMSEGDLVLYYHSGTEKAVVGLARVIRTAYPDPTAREGDWSAIDLEALSPLVKPLPLLAIRSDRALNSMKLLRQPRLSISPVTKRQFDRILALSRTATPRP